ncbi:MAG: SDR family oxidoreductase [Burkholderiales bacterium]|nr:SDR family oxidoreductase [Burkholderiales bacterium]
MTIEINRIPFRADLMDGKRVLVTGGGTGLGRAVTYRMAQLGATVYICGRREEILRNTTKEITEETGAQVTPLRCDIRDSAQVESMFDAIWAEGALDILINNAGANFLARTETLSARAFDTIISIALSGNAYCVLAAGKRWIGAKRGGVILNVLASGATSLGRAFTVPLTMAKSAMLAMTRSLAVEWGPKGIRCVAIAPGIFPTPGAFGQLLPEERIKSYDFTRNIPLGRFGEHDEFANMCAFLTSDAASYVNGDMITIDGGRGIKAMDLDDLFSWTDENWASLKQARKR